MNKACATNDAARAAILGRLSAAPAGTVPPAPAVVPLPPMGDGPYQRFCELLTANRAAVVESTMATWDRDALDWLRVAGCRRVLFAPDTDAGRRLSNPGAARDGDPALIPYDVDIEALKPALVNEIDAAITESRAAIAATGSVVLWPTPAEPRLMSLLPPIHLVLVRKSTLRPTLADVMTEQGWAQAMPTNIILASGPSKTADIAQILAFGVHGPKQLAVMVLTDA